MTKADLIENVYLTTGFSKRESTDILEMVFDLMKATLQNGAPFEKRIRSAFATDQRGRVLAGWPDASSVAGTARVGKN